MQPVTADQLRTIDETAGFDVDIPQELEDLVDGKVQKVSWEDDPDVSDIYANEPEPEGCLPPAKTNSEARSELRALGVASIADLVKRGGCSVLSPAHSELAHEADHLLKLLDDALRARQKADEKAAARRRLQENN